MIKRGKSVELSNRRRIQKGKGIRWTFFRENYGEGEGKVSKISIEKQTFIHKRGGGRKKRCKGSRTGVSHRVSERSRRPQGRGSEEK